MDGGVVLDEEGMDMDLSSQVGHNELAPLYYTRRIIKKSNGCYVHQVDGRNQALHSYHAQNSRSTRNREAI